MPFGIRARHEFVELLSASAAHVVAAGQLLAELLTSEPALRSEAASSLRSLDHDAEASAVAVLRALSDAYVTPVAREDVYAVAWSLRRVVAAVDAVAQDVVVLQLGELPALVTDLVRVVVRSAEVCAVAAPQVARPRAVVDPWLELGRLTKQAAALQRQLVATVTAEPRDTTSMLRLMHLVGSFAAVGAAYDAVADALQTASVKEG